MTRIGVLGAGSWGTTLANLLAGAGHKVRLWAYEAEVVDGINAHHVNRLFLPDAPLHPDLAAVYTPQEAVNGASLVLSASPAHAVRSVLEQVGPALQGDVILASATKGIETDTLRLMSDVATDILPQARFVALSGPSFAQEVHAGQPTAVVAASGDLPAAVAVQQAFSTPRFRVYTGDDVTGTELGGALKNVIAIAAGMLEGLGLGHNARAALLTRGLAEITRLGGALGARASTFAGLAGMGDLILTCCGHLSRNRSLGAALANGISLEAYRATHRTVAEGAYTAQAAVRLAARVGVEMPICAQVHAVLYEGKNPRDGLAELMGRDLKSEHEA